MQLKKNHIAYLDGLRALACLYVLIHHIIIHKYGGVTTPLTSIEKILIIAFRFGREAVGVFIVLSGYCLMLPLVNNNYDIRGGIGTFFKKRAKRILPPYYLAMIFSLVLIFLFIGVKTGTHWDKSIPVTKADIITHIFMIHDWFKIHEAKISHTFWSVSVEWRIYLLFPILVLIWKKAGPLAALLTAAIVRLVLIGIVFVPGFSEVREYALNPYLFLFTCGMIAAELSNADSRYSKWREKLPWGLISLLLLGAILGMKVLPLGDPANREITDTLLGFFIGALLIAISEAKTAGNSNLVRNVLNWRPIVFVGTFSYSIYLIHAPLIQILWQYVIAPLNASNLVSTLLTVAIGAPLIVGASYLFFLACERPFINRLSAKKHPVAVPAIEV